MNEQSRDKWAKELLESALSIDWHDSEPQARRVADAAAAKVEESTAPETGSVPNLTRLKARWQAEALESVSLQRPPGSMQREWLQEEAAEIRRQCEEN